MIERKSSNLSSLTLKPRRSIRPHTVRRKRDWIESGISLNIVEF
jgi:hypothetical protein